MIKYLYAVTIKVAKFTSFEIVTVNRIDNNNADALTRLATSKDVEAMKLVPIEVLYEPSIDKTVDLLEVDHKPSWIDRIRAYLEHDVLLEDKHEVKSLKFQACRYVVINDRLYRRGFSRPLLRCLIPSEAIEVLRDIYEGLCENHSVSRALAHKVICKGYY